ncbi:hypothetical protein SCLCIDRAFT_1160134 [Scleroderma citrinum Foug A]|uniref:Uncharacterized protein n=1 Tax=Scleroderma citrinum Foug A TaxID=1036808 RepID=A0A0C3AY67_9AGAM|nr:hypothetical protein SCLCIDRAFT_1160134 [Scleroderma citrinum Foug A]
MAVEPNTDHSPSNEVEQKYLEEESDEYDSEEEGEFPEGDNQYNIEEEEDEEGDEVESGAHAGSNLTAYLLGPGGNGQNGYIVEGDDEEDEEDEDEDEEYREEASGTADHPIVLESDSNSKSTTAGTKRGAEDLDAEDGKDSEGETATKKTRV